MVELMRTHLKGFLYLVEMMWFHSPLQAQQQLERPQQQQQQQYTLLHPEEDETIEGLLHILRENILRSWSIFILKYYSEFALHLR